MSDCLICNDIRENLRTVQVVLHIMDILRTLYVVLHQVLTEIFVLTIENTDSDLKVNALHYANELLVRVRLFFQNLLQTRLY